MLQHCLQNHFYVGIKRNKMKRLKLFSLSLCVAEFVILSSFVNGFGPRKLYSLEFDRDISSVKVINRQLIITAPYQISVIDNVQWKFRQQGRMKTRIINKDIADPRMVGKIPRGTFKGDKGMSYWVSSRGTNFSNGAIHVMKQTNDYSILGDITVDSGWNYEKAQWVDMNRDGRKDCLTARYRGGVGQMLWFEQPSGQTIWGQRIIHEGLADGNFVGFMYDKKTYICVAGNQFSTLGLYWTMHPRNNWRHSPHVRHRVIDNYGKYYDVQYVDLNKDGRPDILTTTVQIANSRGQVLGYEIPFDIQNAIWKRHVLAGGFQGDYSPGKAQAYWPNKRKEKSERPSIFLTGGSEATLYILSPTPKTKGFGYYKSELSAGVGVPGIPFIIDLNSDSFPEIFVPQGGHVHVFSYDYQSSVAEPPKRGSSSSADKVVVTKPPVRYRPPYFRPTPSAPPPAIPKGIAPVGPRPAGNTFTGPAGTGGSSAIGSNPPARRPSGAGSENRPLAAGSRPTSTGLAPYFAFNPLGGGSSNSPGGAASTPERKVVLADDGWLYTRTEYLPDLLNPPAASSSVAPPGPTVNTSVDAGPYYPQDQPYYPQDENPPSEYYYSDVVVPPNLVLWVTQEEYIFRQEAMDVCEMNNQVLCSLSQLQDAVRIGGVVPDFEWGWFEMENHAANLKGCTPGELRWDGFMCYNGDVAYTEVRQETSLPSLCCSVIKGANVTRQKFVRKSDAERECGKSDLHLCTIHEMMGVWDQSSYKDVITGWFDSDDHVVKMTHWCDVNAASWPGYHCFEGKLEVSQIQSTIQEPAFCCSGAGHATSCSVFTLLALALVRLLVH